MIEQFVEYRTERLTSDNLQLEYMLVDLNSEEAKAKLFLGQQEVLKQRQNDLSGDKPWASRDSLQPEWATYMVEAVPGAPYGNEAAELVQLEGRIGRRYVASRFTDDDTV